jgi:hypothetical protein
MIDDREHTARAATIGEKPIHAEPITPRQNEQQHGAEDREMTSHVSRHVQRSALPAKARR